jgi:ribosomal protein L24E
MTEKKTVLWQAERLALFSNISDDAAVERFRKNHDSFFPRNFWNWSLSQAPTSGPILTLDAASAEAVGRLRREPRIPFLRAFQQVLCEAWQKGFPLEECVRLISSAAVADRLFGKTDVEPDLSSYPVWPYQRAVMFLGVEPWRARFCGLCGTRFVADKPARRFCSNKCSAKARKDSRAVSWSKHGEKWRATYERKKALDKLPKGAKR